MRRKKRRRIASDFFHGSRRGVRRFARGRRRTQGSAAATAADQAGRPRPGFGGRGGAREGRPRGGRALGGAGGAGGTDPGRHGGGGVRGERRRSFARQIGLRREGEQAEDPLAPKEPGLTE